MTNLVIVESPSKSKTIEKYLGSDYVVTSSKGHIRDLATTGKGGLGVDVEDNFKPNYVISRDKKSVVKDLKSAVKQADKVYLATDPDREGEAISWHLAQVLDLNMDDDNRIVFNEVTKNAVIDALSHPRKIDQDLVKSQETRRVLDRIIGFKLSKLLQKKIKSKSAGRVQSVALRLICEREQEINSFIPEEYWKIKALFEKDNIEFEAELTKKGNRKIKLPNEKTTEEVYNALSKDFTITNIKKTVKRRQSKAPFITSTLQQEASSKLNLKARRTMTIAQRLYEGIDIGSETVGLITYMRTDSIRLSPVFVNQARDFIEKNYGKNYLGSVKVSKRTENVQDAHEAIRPTDINRTPESIKKYLTRDQYRVYTMIYARALASLMAPAKMDATSVTMDNNGYTFAASGSVMKFDGYLKVYGDYEKATDARLPELAEQEILTSKSIEKNQHFTKPPARYTEARLIRELEELGIGRPSTYATIIDIIQTRQYVEVVDRTFKPTESGLLTNEKLLEYFDSIINVEYTAKMESTLDEIANGQDTYVEVLTNFENKFEPLLEEAYSGMEQIQPEKTGEICPECGGELVVRKGRFGEFVACSNYPKCKYVKKEETTVEETGETCPKCGSPMVFKNGRYGRFEACSNYPECKYIKSNEPEVTDEKCPNCGSPIVVKRGRFGPFKACSNYPTCKTIIKTPRKKKATS
ncbi:MAG: type I DNA topoisomerase [Erysipelotrichaceae bacterium]|nr:type I DNA topoisomerase [Erysipelotrichaceae bacterium]